MLTFAGRLRLKVFVLSRSLRSAQSPRRGAELRSPGALRPAAVRLLRSDRRLGLPGETLASEAAAITHGAQERQEI